MNKNMILVAPRASRFLELLIEFGHIDPPTAEDILFAASDAYAGTGVPIPLSAIQRLAAARLVREDAPEAGGKDILTADWPLLFY